MLSYVALLFPCTCWKCSVCTRFCHTCIALVALNIHLLNTWYKSCICNSWLLRPACGRYLCSCAEDSSQFIVCLLFWSHTCPFPPSSSVWQYFSHWKCWPNYVAGKISLRSSYFFETFCKNSQTECQMPDEFLHWFQQFFHQQKATAAFPTFPALLSDFVQLCPVFCVVLCCLKSESAFQEDFLGLACNN